MSLEAWITAATVVVMFGALASERVPPAAAVLSATLFLLVIGVIDEAAALSGFANAAPWTVAALYVLAFAGDKTGMMGPLVNRLLGRGDKLTTTSTARLLLPTAGISAFINNTPLVAMLIGQVTTWCNRRGISPSKILLPVSYAAILGGILTVIGTSTNLTASGLLQESGQDPIGLFEITKVSLIPAIAGMVVLVFVVTKILPERKDALEEFTEDLDEFAAQMKVVDGGPLDGITVADAGLRNLKGIYLVEIERDGHMFPAVSPSRVLRGGDRLTFVGESDQVVDFQRSTKGLASAESEHLLEVDSPEHTFYEAVIGADSRQTTPDVDNQSHPSNGPAPPEPPAMAVDGRPAHDACCSPHPEPVHPYRAVEQPGDPGHHHDEHAAAPDGRACGRRDHPLFLGQHCRWHNRGGSCLGHLGWLDQHLPAAGWLLRPEPEPLGTGSGLRTNALGCRLQGFRHHQGKQGRRGQLLLEQDQRGPPYV
jgi:hypothetical protein